MPTFGSLFSGDGLMDLGLTRAGFDVVWQAEIRDFSRALLAKRFPWATQYGDVRGLTGHELERVDLVAGGFPCQDISNAGPRTGIEGSRSGLWGEMARLVGVLRPRYVLVENVAALAVRGLGRVLGDLSTLGFDAEWSVVPACALGAPHARPRLFLLAHTPGEGLEGRSFPDAPRSVLGHVAGRPVRVGTPWANGPDLPRVGYGGADWVDRLHGLGNGVVVPVAEFIGRRLMEVA